jgi:purine nucleosidase
MMRRFFCMLLGASACLAAGAAPVRATDGEVLGVDTGGDVWIDTDAACGTGALRDVDDCLALAYLARAAPQRIGAVSSVFGNAPRATVDGVLDRLWPLWPEGSTPPPRYSGAQRAMACRGNAAAVAIEAALRARARTLVLLGPATNLACALRAAPELAPRVTRVIVVMGARPGHVFHPAEGAPEAILFGHGPIVRDLNVQADPDAMQVLLDAGVPVILVPYEVARQVSVNAEDVDRMEGAAPLVRSIAPDARAWLGLWTRYIGREGFYPFDLLAGVFLLHPERFQCTPMLARVTADRAISGWRFGPRRLLVGPLPWTAPSQTTVSWCAAINNQAPEYLAPELFAQ